MRSQSRRPPSPAIHRLANAREERRSAPVAPIIPPFAALGPDLPHHRARRDPVRMARVTGATRALTRLVADREPRTAT